MATLIRQDINAHAHEEFPVHIIGAAAEGGYLGVRYTTGAKVRFTDEQIILGQPRDRPTRCRGGRCHHMTIDQSGLCVDHHGRRGC